MSGACTKFEVEKPEGKGALERPRIDGEIILKWMYVNQI